MRKYIHLTVFVSGMTSLAVEMSASRLLGNVFGTSNLVWASIIGLILIYLAIGYFLGGYWADRSPSSRTFYLILLWAAITTAIIPVISHPVLRAAANAFDELELGVLFGSFAAVLILLCIPITLMGTASPFAIRLVIQDTQNIGKTSGVIYAISTLGSFIGTFLPVLLLIPTIGTYRTFLTASALLLIVALIGLWQTAGWNSVWPYLWTLFLIPMIIIWGLPGSMKATPGQIFETESGYNYIQVLQQDEYLLLRLNEGQGIHSVYHPIQLNYYGPWEQMLVGPFFNPAPYDPSEVKKMAIIGLAAGTTAHQATEVYGPIQIDGFEIDPIIVEVGSKYFDMNQSNLNIIVQDGRWGLSHSQDRYQIISLDAYRAPYIPWHVTTQEFFIMVHEHLTEDGVIALNVGRGPDDRRLINSLCSTVLTVFPSVHVMDIPNTFNSIVFATVQQTEPGNLMDNLLYLMNDKETHPLLLEAIQLAVINLQPPPQQGLVFTDDLAPVEWITNDMILDYLFYGDLESIK